MSSEFQTKVELDLGEILFSKGFHLEDITEADSGNISIIIYSSPSAKIGIFRSKREGEVNCLIGPLVANNSNLDDGNWLYLRSLLLGDDEPSLEELLAAVPEAPKSDEEQLKEISVKLDHNLDSILEGLPKQ